VDEYAAKQEEIFGAVGPPPMKFNIERLHEQMLEGEVPTRTQFYVYELLSRPEDSINDLPRRNARAQRRTDRRFPVFKTAWTRLRQEHQRRMLGRR
jgi:hypothetical protein